jgi:uncharacterized protein (DUF433 family)
MTDPTVADLTAGTVGRYALLGMTADALLKDYDDGRYSEKQVIEILRERRDRRLNEEG